MLNIAQLKINVIEYYQKQISHIDQKTSTLIIDSTEYKRKKFLSKSEEFLKICQKTMMNTIEEINKAEENDPTTTTLSIEKFEKNFVSSYCLLIELAEIKNQIGFLITSDWKMTENEINFIREQFKTDLLMDYTKIEDTILTENIPLIKHVFNQNRQLNSEMGFKSYGKDIIDFKESKNLISTIDLSLSYSLIKKNAFQGYGNLEHLVLGYGCTPIEIIETSAFDGLNKLVFLELSYEAGNDLNCCGQLNGLTNLKQLDICKNEFKIDLNVSDLFKNMSKIVSLNLSDCLLHKHVTKGLFTGLWNIEKLYLVDCDIEKIERGSFSK